MLFVAVITIVKIVYSAIWAFSNAEEFSEVFDHHALNNNDLLHKEEVINMLATHNIITPCIVVTANLQLPFKFMPERDLVDFMKDFQTSLWFIDR